MKKCATIIFYSALFLLFSCSDGKKATINGNAGMQHELQDKEVETNSGQAKNGVINIDTIKIHEEYTFAYIKENAPTLTIDIKLPTIDLGNKESTAKLDSTLALGIFSLPYTLRESCDSFISIQKSNFDGLRDEYHNLKNEGVPPGMMQQYCDIAADTIIGYKGCINYIVRREEYAGGAHPSTIYNILNFDPATGNEIAFYDIFKEGCEDILTAMLIEELMNYAQVSDMDELHEKGFLFIDTEMFISQNFILGKEGITFLYNRYEIAPYAMGDIKLTINYTTLKEIMK